MHHASSLASNPFGMLVDPEAVVRALEGSQRLESLNRRVCRPLDRQSPPKATGSERDGFDAAHDREEPSASEE